MRAALFYLVVFGCNIVQGVTGFGNTMLAMAPSLALLGTGTAKAVLNLFGLAAGAVLWAKNRRYVEKRVLRTILLWMSLGAAAGLSVQRYLPQRALLLAYACFLLCYGGMRLLRTGAAKPLSPAAGAAVLMGAGALQALFVSGGSLLVVFAAGALPDKRAFRATLSPVWAVLNTALAVSHAAQGLLTPGALVLAAGGLFFVALGVAVGSRLHERVSREAFLKLAYLLLMINGGVLLAGQL